MEPYNFALILGLSFFVIGAVVLFLVFRFVRTNRFKHMITGLTFLIGGMGIIMIVILILPTPEHQQNLRERMLSLLPDKIDQLTMYNRENLSESIVEVQEREVIEEWATILKTCHQFNPDHPRYETKYMVIVQQDGDKYLYELGLDKKSPNTVDLNLLEYDSVGDGFYNLGYYRCEGLLNSWLPVNISNESD
jgi:ABC-type lipoprotein release transport system permease subunit